MHLQSVARTGYIDTIGSKFDRQTGHHGHELSINQSIGTTGTKMHPIFFNWKYPSIDPDFNELVSFLLRIK